MVVLSNQLFLTILFHMLVVYQVDLAAPVQHSALNKLLIALQDRPCDLERSKNTFPYLPKTCCSTPVKNPNKNTGSLSDSYTVICTGVEEIPVRFPDGTKRLTLIGTSICKLKQESFNQTQLSLLSSFSMVDDDSLHSIGSNTFSNLKSLISIVFDNVPNLASISGSAFSGLPILKSITIKGSGLSHVQGFNAFDTTARSYLSIFLSRNLLLKTIPTNAFHKISHRPLILNITNNPALEIVEDYAFNGSNVGVLDLSFNRVLTHLSPQAFVGSKNLDTLYLQNSPIEILPSKGLRSLKTLNVLGVPSMARFPNSLNLPNLKSAVLTYPYHCCALNKKYGFGETFQKDLDPNEGRVEIDCVTGQEVLPNMTGFGDISDSIFPTNKTAFVQNVIYHDEIIELTNETDFFALLNLSAILGNDFESDENDDGWFGDFNNQEEHSWNWAGDSPSSGDDVPSNDHVTPTDEAQPTTVPETTQASTKMTTATTSGPQTAKPIKICYRDANGNIQPLKFHETFSCSPELDDFNPCEDLLGDEALVVISFIVAVLAVLGNTAVVVTLLFVAFDRSPTEQRQLTVPKFLILNLAFGDLCMGIYILTLSIVGAKSKGSYYQIGVEWQTMGGCDAVGFLSIFSSQLSIYTLSVISLERWYAIRNAINLEKRMTLKVAIIVMAIGWLYSILAAMLPLFGVNSYQKTAICLPMDVENNFGLAYLGIILTLDKIGFILVVGCYIWMYVIVRTTKDDRNTNKQSCFDFFKIANITHLSKPKKRKRNGNYGVMDKRNSDARVAKKMAVLVFTDFACFFPIYFFSLFALIGLPLVTVSTAKILLVLCYPFNACCNPFLYALLTKSFRNDLRLMIRSFICSRFCFNYGQNLHVQKSKKSPEPGKKETEKRKTVQILVDGDSPHPQQKGSPCSTKATFLKSRTASFISNSRRSSSANKTMKPKNLPHKNNEAMNTINERKSSKGSDTGSNNVKDDKIETRAWHLFLARLGIPFFKQKKTPLPKQSSKNKTEHNAAFVPGTPDTNASHENKAALPSPEANDLSDQQADPSASLPVNQLVGNQKCNSNEYDTSL